MSNIFENVLLINIASEIILQLFLFSAVIFYFKKNSHEHSENNFTALALSSFLLMMASHIAILAHDKINISPEKYQYAIIISLISKALGYFTILYIIKALKKIN